MFSVGYIFTSAAERGGGRWFSNEARASVSPTDLALSGRAPSNGSSATHRVALRKAARPPGQATARGPLQCRVGPPVQLPLVQIRVNRTIKNYYFRGSLLAPLFGRWPEVCRSTLSVQLLRAQSDNSLPEACLTRERGARESRAGGPSRARALTRHATQSEFGLPEACSQPKAKVQPDGVKPHVWQRPNKQKN